MNNHHPQEMPYSDPAVDRSMDHNADADNVPHAAAVMNRDSGSSISSRSSRSGSGNNDDHDGTVLTLEDAMDRIGYGRFQQRLLVAAGLCSASDAMEILVLTFLSLSVQEEWQLTTVQTSTLVSSVFVGALGGTLFLGRLADVKGRRLTFLLTAALVAVFGLFSAMCQSYWSLVLTRAMVGVGIGGVTVPFDTYGECLPSASRGKGLVYPSYFWTAGTLLVVLGARLTLHADGSGWRWLCLWCAVPCVIATLVGYLVVPESPQWLLAHDAGAHSYHPDHSSTATTTTTTTTTTMEHAKALTILRDAALQNGLDPDEILPLGTRLVLANADSTSDATAINATSTIVTTTNTKPQEQGRQVLSSFHDDDNTVVDPSISIENLSSSSVWDLLSPNRIRSSLAILSIWFGYAMMYYGTILATTVVFSSTSSHTSSSTNNNNEVEGAGGLHFDYLGLLLASTAEVAGTTFLVWTIDRWGRQLLHALSFGLGGVLICGLCWAAAATNGEDNHDIHAASTTYTTGSGVSRWWIMLLAFGGRFWVYNGSVITWIWTAEILETKFRTTGHGLANAGGRVGGFLAPYLVAGVSFPTFGLVLWMVSWVLVGIAWYNLPETLGSPMGTVLIGRRMDNDDDNSSRNEENDDCRKKKQQQQQKELSSLELSPSLSSRTNKVRGRSGAGKQEYQALSSSSSLV